jgi:putative phosphoesterase
MRIGLVSDTHDLLRPAVLDFLRGSDHIVHAGDICGPAVLDALRAIAPLTVVGGNNDRGAWADPLRETEEVTLGGVRILVIHDLKDLAAASLANVRVVISGHSHKPLVKDEGGVLFVNPGSAGPRRFKLPISAAELRIHGARVDARLVRFEA